MDEKIIVLCPHCEEYIEVLKLNCCIFRHGVFKHNGKQIDPHCKKDLCDKYINENLIYGCGKPFKIIKDENGNFIPEICDYI